MISAFFWKVNTFNGCGQAGRHLSPPRASLQVEQLVENIQFPKRSHSHSCLLSQFSSGNSPFAVNCMSLGLCSKGHAPFHYNFIIFKGMSCLIQYMKTKLIPQHLNLILPGVNFTINRMKKTTKHYANRSNTNVISFVQQISLGSNNMG